VILIQEEERTDFERYMDELDEKVRRVREASADTPRIGIFWLHAKDGKIRVYFSYTEELEFGQEFGNFTVCKQDHYAFWENMKNHGLAPKNSNYEDLPRGRVAYDREKKEYVVFHGKYLSSSLGIKSVIKSEFKLQSNTRWEPDTHYHKFKRWGF
jgi:hypothetical protein